MRLQGAPLIGVWCHHVRQIRQFLRRICQVAAIFVADLVTSWTSFLGVAMVSVSWKHFPLRYPRRNTMKRWFTGNELFRLRNLIPVDRLIKEQLNIPSKDSEGYFRFLCPLCNEFQTATNLSTNLARCFRCEKNFNPIDLTMMVKGIFKKVRPPFLGISSYFR